MNVSALAPQTMSNESLPRYLPTRSMEYFFYAWMFYSIMGPALGFSISLAGVSMLAGLAGLCALRMERRLTAILQPTALLLACGVSFVAVQVLILSESLVGGSTVDDTYIRAFVPWMLGIVIIQCLALRRGFLHRFAIVAFLIGLMMLPYLSAERDASGRMGLERGAGVANANPNDLGAWFGFCCVYFTILGIETRRNLVRAVSWLCATGSLVVVGLTVSRAPAFAAAVGILVAFRRVLKRGFVPFLLLAVAGWIVYGLGLFERSASLYVQRGFEESGRFLVWPVAIEHFLRSPWTGVGASNVGIYITEAGREVSPHNSFIFIALASGALPLVFYVANWVRVSIDVFKLNAAQHEDALFQMPLFLYCLLISLELNQPFMEPWMMVTLGSVTGAAFLLNARQAVAARTGPRHAARPQHLPAPAIDTRT